MTIPVCEIFSSVQGEGINSGKGSLFVRVSGCNFRCDFCDSAYAFDVREDHRLSPDMLSHKIIRALEGTRIRHLVITGGEPSLYFEDFGKMWRSDNFQSVLKKLDSVDVETNGFIPVPWEDLSGRINVCISPKWDQAFYQERSFPQEKYKFITMKLIVSSVGDAKIQIEKVRSIFKIKTLSKIWLQPLNNDYNVARELVANDVLGCRLSMQVHKILGVA